MRLPVVTVERKIGVKLKLDIR